jgi:hypothetical protein
VNLDEETLRRRIHDGIHAAAEQPIAAPDLLAGVARRARRNARRTRVAGALGAVALVAVGSLMVADLPRLGNQGTNGVTSQTTSPTKAPVTSCPPDSPAVLPQKGPADALFTGQPTSATLCVYDPGGNLKQAAIDGARWAGLEAALRPGEVLGGRTCLSSLVFGKDLLILHYADGTVADLLIDNSGCGTVTNGAASRYAPARLHAEQQSLLR